MDGMLVTSQKREPVEAWKLTSLPLLHKTAQNYWWKSVPARRKRCQKNSVKIEQIFYFLVPMSDKT